MKKSKLFILVSLIACVLLSVLAYFTYGPGVLTSYRPTELSDIADLKNDDQGNTYILNNAGYELIRVNKEGKIDLKISGKSEQANSFYRGLHVAVDSEDHIYVHQRIASEDALAWIGKENIQVFDSNGKYLYTTCEIEYETPVLTSSILNIQEVNGCVYAVCLEEDGIAVKDVNSKSGKTYHFDNAKNLISSVYFYPTQNCVFVTTKKAEVYKVSKFGSELMYEGESSSVLQGVHESQSGDLYVCDIGNYAVLEYIDGEFTPIYETEEAVYSIETTGEMVYNFSSFIIRNDEEFVEVGFASNVIIRSILFYVLCLLILASLAYPLYKIVGSLLASPSQTVRRISGFVIMVSILTGCFCTIIAKEFKSILTDSFVEKAMQSAKTINNLMDGDAFERIRTAQDYYGEDYLGVKNVAENVILDNGEVPTDMYIIMYTLEDDYNVVVRYELEQNKGCNYPYVWSDGTDEEIVYNTGNTFLLSDATDSEGTFLCVYSPITNSKGEVVGVIEVGTDSTIFDGAVRERLNTIVISIIVFSVVSLLILLEIIEFMEAKKTIDFEKIKQGLASVPLKMYRILVFLVFFITNITTPFLSIYSLSLSDTYSVLSGIPSEILAAVPISAEVLFGAIFSMLGGSFIEKKGNRKVGIFGAILFTAGLIVRFIWPDLLVLTLGNAMQGAGWGLVLLIINSKIAAEEDDEKQEAGFSDYNIALQNGINSGIVLGGFLISFSNYKGILMLAAAISAVVFVIVYKYFRDMKEEKEVSLKKENALVDYVKFIFTPRVLIYFICIVVPVIAASYYLNFLYPILADRLGMSESYIGYSYLLNGLVIICFGNLIVNVMSKYFNRRILLMIASLIYLVTFVLIGYMNNITALLISLVLIAISDSFGYVAQSTFYTDMKETHDFGYEKAMGVYSLFENLSQSAGSFIFGYILTVGVKTGMTVYGCVIGICGIIFALSMKGKGKKHED